MIRFQVLTSAGELDSIRAEWDALACRPSATLFQGFSWNRLAAEVFAERETPHVIVARDAQHSVILPLVLRHNGAAALLGETLFDYRDMLSTGDRGLELAALSEAAQLGMPLEITALHPHSLDRWPLPTRPFCNAPRVDRASCSAQQLVSRHRRFGRLARRIAARGVRFCARSGNDRDFVREIYLRKSQQAGSLFVDPLRREFMERICTEKSCEIFTYESGTDVLAALVTFRGPGARHCYTVCYDTAWKELSPGRMLLYEATRDGLMAGLSVDYLTGEQPYKMWLATEAVPLLRVELTAEEWREALAECAAERAA